MTFAKEAWPFVLPVAVAAAVALSLRRPVLAAILAALALAVLLFFRIPARRSEATANTVLAPANGRITSIETVTDPSFAEGEFYRIVTFLSVFNVHVQRAPVAGEVVATHYRRGRKVAAFRPDAGEINESRLAVLRTDGGDTIAVQQLAGLVARRVVSYLEQGDRVERGDLIGVIKFGSRVDLYLPTHYRLLVEKGQTVHEGQTTMATSEAPPQTDKTGSGPRESSEGRLIDQSGGPSLDALDLPPNPRSLSPLTVGKGRPHPALATQNLTPPSRARRMQVSSVDRRETK